MSELLHQQLMGRSPSRSSFAPHSSTINPSSPHQAIVDPLARNSSSPYHSATLFRSSTSLTSSSPSHRPLTSLSLEPSTSALHPAFSTQHPPFDPDIEAELVRRRKLENRRSQSLNSPDNLLTSLPTSRRGSIASSISSLGHSQLRSSSRQSRRPLPNGSPLSQVHRPSPLRSASTPTLNAPATDPAPLSDKARHRQMKAEYDQMRNEVLSAERVRLKAQRKRKSTWFSRLAGPTSGSAVDENKVHLQLDDSSDVSDPFRKSMLDPLTALEEPVSRPSTPSKRRSTFSRFFGTLLASSNKTLSGPSISVVDSRSPVLGTSGRRRKGVKDLFELKPDAPPSPAIPSVFLHPTPDTQEGVVVVVDA